MMSKPVCLPLAVILLVTGLLAPTAKTQVRTSRFNKDAQALAKLLAPIPPAKAANPGELGKQRERMTQAIEYLEASYRSNGPQPESLLTNALRHREDMASFEKLMVNSAVLNAWREANARGLFDENARYRGRITKGRGEGDRCTFELIVPAAIYPPACNQLANVRLVPVENARKEGAELTHREKSFHQQLVKMIQEKENRAKMVAFEKGPPPEKRPLPEKRPPTNSLGQDEQTSLELWNEAKKAAGEAADQLPVIRVLGKITGTPSRKTQERWRATTQVTNLSAHPTEVTVEVYLLGVTDEKRDHYLMSKTTKTLKLRQNENLSFDSFTRAENSYKNNADNHDEVPKNERNKTRVRCRGFVVMVKHGDKVAAFTGSDRLLSSYADPAEKDSPLFSLPAF